jgi:hypothetical protein
MSVTIKPIILSVVTLCVIMLSVVAPLNGLIRKCKMPAIKIILKNLNACSKEISQYGFQIFPFSIYVMSREHQRGKYLQINKCPISRLCRHTLFCMHTHSLFPSLSLSLSPTNTQSYTSITHLHSQTHSLLQTHTFSQSDTQIYSLTSTHMSHTFHYLYPSL